jgi:hypothetical protein
MAKAKAKMKSRFLGRWSIVPMSAWDEDQGDESDFTPKRE